MIIIELLFIVETLKEFKGMRWGQRTKVFTDHKNLIQDVLGLTSDDFYCWKLLLDDFGPKIIHIKGIHNNVADAISRLDFGLVQDEKANWMTCISAGAITPCMLLTQRSLTLTNIK